MCNQKENCKCPEGKELIHCGCECHKQEEANTERWYEVFIDLKFQTRTIACFDTLKEAEDFREKIAKDKQVYFEGAMIDIDNINCIHIDQWEQKDFPFGTPYPIESII